MSVPVIKPLMTHLKDLLSEKEGESQLTKDIKSHVLIYLNRKYDSQVLDVCSSVDPQQTSISNVKAS